jgi:flagellin-like protein
MRFVKGFARFWYDFIVGDDWKIAAAVVTTLAVSAAVTASVSTGASWLAPVIGAALMLAFTVSLVADIRR